MSTSSAGSSLDNAVKQSKDPKLLVKLLTALDSTDAHVIDIKYNKSCWAKHVTAGVLRKTIKDDEERSRRETAAKLEFLNLTQAALDSGEILNIAQLEQSFDSISNENNSPKTLIRRSVKELIQKEIKGIEFHKPTKANEPERVSVKQHRDAAIHIVELTADSDESMKTPFDAASILRKAINQSET